MDATRTANRQREFLATMLGRPPTKLEVALRCLVLEIEKSDEVPYNIREAAGLVREAIDEV